MVTVTVTVPNPRLEDLSPKKNSLGYDERVRIVARNMV